MPNWPKLVSRVRVSNLFGWREDGCAAGDSSFQRDDVQLRVDDYKDFLTHKIKLRDWKSVHISPPKAFRKTDKASTTTYHVNEGQQLLSFKIWSV